MLAKLAPRTGLPTSSGVLQTMQAEAPKPALAKAAQPQQGDAFESALREFMELMESLKAEQGPTGPQMPGAGAPTMNMR